jgi:hypothetical protein
MRVVEQLVRRRSGLRVIGDVLHLDLGPDRGGRIGHVDIGRNELVQPGRSQRAKEAR